MEYEIISADSRSRLEELAAKLIAKGYIPTGGVAVTQYTNGFPAVCIQAMIRIETKKATPEEMA